MRTLLIVLLLSPCALDAADATEIWIGRAYQMSGLPCSNSIDVEELGGGDYARCLQAAHRLEVNAGHWKKAAPIILVLTQQ